MASEKGIGGVRNGKISANGSRSTPENLLPNGGYSPELDDGGCSPSSNGADASVLCKAHDKVIATRKGVLIVHRMPLIRYGLKAMLERTGRFRICAETDTAPIARHLFVRHQPAVVVLGLTCHGGDGLELIKDFQKINPATGILVLTTCIDPFTINRVFRAGARACLVADDGICEVLFALDQILTGKFYASNRVTPQLLKNLAGRKRQRVHELEALSDREFEVFSFIGRGFGASRLANELHLSVKTIESHQMHIKTKLGLRSAAELSEKATLWALASVQGNLQAGCWTGVRGS